MEKNDHIVKHMFAGDPDRPVYDHEYLEYIQEENVKLAKAKRPIHIFAPQAGFQEKVLECEAEVLIIGGRRGGGKFALIDSGLGPGYDGLVVTPFGLRKLKDVHVGDTITAKDGGFTKVIAETEIHERDCYKVNFSDESFLAVGDNHLWLTRRTCHKTKSRVLNGGGLEDDYRIWTTKSMFDFLENQKVGKNKKESNFLIPLCDPVRFTKSGNSMRKTDIDPYIIGAIIGDGCVANSIQTNRICAQLTSMDEEIVQQFTKQGICMDRWYQQVGNKAKIYYMSNDKLKESLQLCKMIGCKADAKFIPTCYKYGTVEERFALVQGMMDTDGYIDDRGHCSYATISKQLADDFKFVIQSLGGTVTIFEKQGKYKDKNGVEVICNIAYECYIRIPETERLFRLSRKKNRCKEFNGGVSERCRRIVSIEYIGKHKGKCIQVSKPDGLYLANDFIVTHNSAVMVLSALYHIDNPLFIARGFRKEIGDVERGLWNTSKGIYTGVAVPAETDHRWTFESGAQSIYDHLQNESPSVIDQRFRGVEMPHIIIDELPQIQQNTFFTLLASNRNTIGAVNKFICSCNPVPKHHWVYKMISWYIDEETRAIIPERDGKIRYFHKWGKTVDEIEWGNTKEEVYQKAKVYIDALIDPDDPEDGPDNYITSFCFIEGNYNDNKIFKSIDSSYKGRLAQQGGAQSAKDIKGIWGDVEDGEILLTRSEMEDCFFNNNPQTTGRYTAVADVALSKDFFVIYALNGGHVFDVEFFTGVLSDEAIGFIDKFLSKNHIREENFAYDSNGLGLFLEGFFKKARKFNNRATATDPKLWNNYKSECAERWVNAVKARKYSIDPNVLARKVIDKRNGITMTVAERLQAERPALQRKVTDNGRFEIIQKSDMKSIIGHSPDFIEGIFMNEIFSKGYVKVRNLGMI